MTRIIAIGLLIASVFVAGYLFGKFEQVKQDIDECQVE